MSPKKAILLAFLLTPLMMVAMAKYVIVDVRESAPDGLRLWVPVPLIAAQAALQFAPDEARHIREKDFTEFLPLLRAVAKELKNAGDAELVRVEDKDQRVLVTKSGVDLVVDVSGPDQQVHVAVPVEAVEEFLDGTDGKCLHPADILSALGGISGDLVYVKDSDTEVKVWLW
jgi:hypothetical protein